MATPPDNGHIHGAGCDRWSLVFDASVPCTSGGDDITIERLASFTDAHYSQQDKSLNNTLWSLIPITTVLSYAMHPAPREIRDCDHCHNPLFHGDSPLTGQGYDPALVAEFVPMHERNRIATELGILNLIQDGFKPTSCIATDCPHAALHDAVVRFSTRAVEPLKDAVERITKLKDVANVHFGARRYEQAMKGYHSALFGLYPWIATPLIFSSKDAFGYGIAQLECTLWSNMAGTAAKLATSDAPWNTVARECADVLIHKRFVTNKLLAKAYYRAAVALTVELRYMGPLDAVLAGYLHMWVSLTARAETAPGEWAHKNCVYNHQCGDPDFATSAVRKALDSDRQTTFLNDLPLDLERILREEYARTPV